VLCRYKNPKKTARDRGGSAMQPQQYSFADLEAPVTAPDFARQSLQSVRDEEVWLLVCATEAVLTRRL
jgi:hypothetical protein